MRSLLAALAYTAAAQWRDECSYFKDVVTHQPTAKLHIEFSTITDTYCNDSGLCEGLIGSDGHPITCVFAWSFVQPLQELQIVPQEGIRPMPKMMIAPAQDIRFAVEDDRLLRAFEGVRDNPMEHSSYVQQALCRFLDPRYPDEIHNKLCAIERLIFHATEHVVRSFPIFCLTTTTKAVFSDRSFRTSMRLNHLSRGFIGRTDSFHSCATANRCGDLCG